MEILTKQIRYTLKVDQLNKTCIIYFKTIYNEKFRYYILNIFSYNLRTLTIIYHVESELYFEYGLLLDNRTERRSQRNIFTLCKVLEENSHRIPALICRWKDRDSVPRQGVLGKSRLTGWTSRRCTIRRDMEARDPYG